MATGIRERLRGRGVVRDPDEERTASRLELFFDLIFVVGISQASEALHQELAAGHPGRGVLGFAGAFFAVWWAWMNSTWFASAHETDDVAYRLLTLVQMGGVLVLAAGLSRAVHDSDFAVATVGYAIMRAGLVWHWLRVARDEPDVRARALRYAGGTAVLQVLWLLRLATPEAMIVPTFAALGLAELLVPVWAERTAGDPLFNPVHIEERYSLFTLILLGESILAASLGFNAVFEEQGISAGLFAVGVGGLALAFSIWWLYFDHPGHLTPTRAQAFRWGYGHVVVFMALAALGGGVHTAADGVAGGAAERTAALAVALPAAGFLVGVAVVMLLTGSSPLDARVVPKFAGAAAMVLVGLLLPVAAAVVACAVLMMTLALLMLLAGPGSVPEG